ncbi:class II fructose-bisphosphatase [Geotoga petraea]|jgi:fructose-1,6-bisphosphatase II|uniref:Fructose-1,6-bisphosphatase n=1 Tax=Geotoga petraea TaxID=28234 RepID=A0A1G6N0P8_9BACT|nr:class II fructose-bisphosphatase [Geotoga petraea]MDK2945927.1 fructose,6-bisphosphatase [Geotoga sp.]TGG87275.1 class II fructose-bisphosphatase [Geotoga petraea]SDC61393.1 fructose-1,6-bisphosphatase II [Geotoga petraea]
MAKELYPEITLDLVRVTEAASLMSSLYLGFGNKEAVDGAAVDAMRGMLDYIDIKGRVVIGEGEKDEAPMLYYGEKVGMWDDESIEMDIAVDPIDGTRLVAYGLPNALSVMVGAENDKILCLPTFYSYKLAVGPELKGKLDLNASLKENIKVAAAILGLPISELTVVVLNRERHRKIIDEIREIGARIKLIGDGDIAGAIATCMPESGVNMYVGIGGSPEAILAAAALRTLGGEMQLKIWPRDEEERKKINLEEWDLNRIYITEELVGGEHVIFAATGVTDGDFLKGVKYIKGKAITESIVMRTSSETVRRITTYHDLKKKKIRIKSLDGDEKFINLNKIEDEGTSILKNKLFS